MKISFISALVFLAMPMQANAALPLYRHVLACVDDGPLSAYELGAKFSPSGLYFADAEEASSSLERDNPERSSGLGEISEGADNVTVTFSTTKIRLSDGKYKTVNSSYSLPRLTFSYGSGEQAALSPGWAYIFAVYNSGSGQIELTYQNSLNPPSRAHRYVGSIYLKLAADCAEDPVLDPDECSMNPPCLGTSSCGSSYGRLVGVPLQRKGNKYIYKIDAKVGACVSGKCPVENISPLAVSQTLGAEGGSSATTLYSGPISRDLFPGMWATYPRTDTGISIDASTVSSNTILLKGHEEDITTYE
jgi:hypothetical protein